MRAVWGACLIALWAAQVWAFTATDDYSTQRVEGWLIRIAPDYSDDPEALEQALTEVRRQLGNVAGAVPEPALSAVRETVFWLEYRRDAPKRSVYHRSAGWLSKNGYNPDKALGIEIDHGIITRRTTAPWSLMHELTHAYFDQVVERDAPELEAAFSKAIQSKRYDNVLRNTGRRQQAYALNNVSEYFAELSEAYFGENDFEPFDRAALKAFDPDGFAAVEALWTR